MPLNGTDSMVPTVPRLSSVKASIPPCAPPEVGVNVTLSEQLPPGAIGEAVTQCCVEAKLAAGGWGAVTAVTCKGALPRLVTVILCGALVVPTYWFPKLRLVGEIEDIATATPVPLRDTDWVAPAVPPLSSVNVSAPVNGPDELG